MIKCSGFGKLLKQLFSIGLISCFILLGNSFASAGQIFITNGEYTTSDNLHYDFTFQNGNNFLANGEYRVFSVFSSEYYPSAYPRFYNVFWTNDGLYVIQTCQGGYECSNIHTAIQQQGYLSSYCETSYSLNCTSPNIPIESFIGNDSYKNPSSFTLHDAGQNLNFCFDYEDLDKSICFNAGVWYSLSNSLGFGYNPFPSELGTSSDTISSYFSLSSWGLPSSGGGDIGVGEGGLDGNISGTVNNTITGDYVYSNCTYQQIFDYIESFGYNEYVCYGGLDNFNLYDSSISYNPIPLSGKTLGQILSYSNARDSPNDWFTFWNGLYIDRYNQNFNAMWESYPAVYRTWFDLYYRYGGGNLIFDTVREYCAMKQLNIDFNTTKYKGQYFKVACDSIKQGNQYGYDSGDSQNVDGVNWVGVGNMGSSSGSSVSNNPTVFIQNFFNELKANLPTRYDLGGCFLPLYIITFMCAIILFRFLSH